MLPNSSNHKYYEKRVEAWVRMHRRRSSYTAVYSPIGYLFECDADFLALVAFSNFACQYFVFHEQNFLQFTTTTEAQKPKCLGRWTRRARRWSWTGLSINVGPISKSLSLKPRLSRAPRAVGLLIDYWFKRTKSVPSGTMARACWGRSDPLRKGVESVQCHARYQRSTTTSHDSKISKCLSW